MIKKASLFAAFSVSAMIAGTPMAASQERVISDALKERYKYSEYNGGPSSGDKECSGLRDFVSNGNLLKRQFGNGKGRFTIQGSEKDGGSIGFKIERGTRGLPLEPQDCASGMP